MKLRTNGHFVLMVVSVVVGSQTNGRADDWPLVRGNVFGTGVAYGKLPDSLEVLWKVSVSEDAGFDATAVISNGVIYVGDNAGTFHAIRLGAGTEVWKKDFPDSGFGAGAAVEGERLYVGDMNGAIYCMSTADGKEIWTGKLEGEVYAGPTPNGDDVLFTCEAGTLSCRKKQDGKDAGSFISRLRYAARRRSRADGRHSPAATVNCI